jgi:hypothetical protein
MAVSVSKLGSFLFPNGTVFILTSTDIRPFKSIRVVTVNMSSNYSILVLERAFDISNCSTVYALLSTKFLGSATFVAEIAIINGSILRQFDASPLSMGLGLSDIWDISGSESSFVMMNGVGIINLRRGSFELIRIYKPNDGILGFSSYFRDFSDFHWIFRDSESQKSAVPPWSLYKRIKQIFDVAVLYLRYQSTSRGDLETCSQISSSPTELYLVELEEEI